MQKHELVSTKLMVALQGGEIVCHNEKGDENWAVGLLAGMHDAKQFAPYMSKTDVLEMIGPIIALTTIGGRTTAQNFGQLARESGANPDFRPTTFTAAEIRMRKLVEEVNQKASRVDQQIAAMTKAKKMKADAKPAPKPKEPTKHEVVLDKDGKPVEAPKVEPVVEPKTTTKAEPIAPSE